ncbi:MAG: stage II sporulation protein R [Bacilli bacterium]
MKKIIVILFVITILLCLTNNKQEVLIPSDAIRFRIIANSNSIKDQQEKLEIKEELEPVLASILSNSSNHNNTKETIMDNMDNIKRVIEKHNINYEINYGNNYFPEKTYKGVRYPEGNYESLVITLGEGIGENWWCVLFPPLCLLEASEANYDEVTYTTYFQEILDNFK